MRKNADNDWWEKIKKECNIRYKKSNRKPKWKRWNAMEAPTPNTYGVKDMYKGMIKSTLEDGVDEDTFRALHEKQDALTE